MIEVNYIEVTEMVFKKALKDYRGKNRTLDFSIIEDRYYINNKLV